MKIDFEEMLMDAIEIEDEVNREAVFKFLKSIRKKYSTEFFKPNPITLRGEANIVEGRQQRCDFQKAYLPEN